MKKIILILITIFCILTLIGCKEKNEIEKAIENNDIEYIQKYFNSNPDKINELMDNNVYPLHYACMKSANLDLIKLLIELYNADINLIMDNNTPLTIACSLNNKQVIQYLLTNKADNKYLETLSSGKYIEEIDGLEIYTNNNLKYILSYETLNYIFYNETSINKEMLAVRILDFISIEVKDYMETNPLPEEIIEYSKKYFNVVLLVATCELDEQYAQEADTKLLIELLKILEENEGISKETLKKIFN